MMNEGRKDGDLEAPGGSQKRRRKVALLELRVQGGTDVKHEPIPECSNVIVSGPRRTPRRIGGPIRLGTPSPPEYSVPRYNKTALQFFNMGTANPMVSFRNNNGSSQQMPKTASKVLAGGGTVAINGSAATMAAGRRGEGDQQKSKTQKTDKKKACSKYYRFRPPPRPPPDAATGLRRPPFACVARRALASSNGKPKSGLFPRKMPSKIRKQVITTSLSVLSKPSGSGIDGSLKPAENNDPDGITVYVPPSPSSSYSSSSSSSSDGPPTRDPEKGMPLAPFAASLFALRGETIGGSRETWSKKADFLLSIIGFAVDLANVWRFPFFCYRNGGGAFLVPYMLMLVFGAMPLFFMELALGQYNRQGPVSVWKICPIFKGVGYCAVLVAFYVSFYYTVIIAWAFYFLFASLQSTLPWTRCDGPWNTPQCSMPKCLISSSSSTASTISTTGTLSPTSAAAAEASLMGSNTSLNYPSSAAGSLASTGTLREEYSFFSRQSLPSLFSFFMEQSDGARVSVAENDASTAQRMVRSIVDDNSVTSVLTTISNMAASAAVTGSPVTSSSGIPMTTTSTSVLPSVQPSIGLIPEEALSPVSPAFEYFSRQVLELQESTGIDDLGPPRWDLLACLMLVYSLLYLSLFKGVKASGKVVWVTATMPYIILSILLLRGLFLPGAFEGIIYYISPDLSRLRTTQVWVDAAVQIFYSVGAGFGVHLTYASYNTFHNNCYRDCVITTGVNSFTSIFSGLVIFTYLGYMSHCQGIHISKVATEGPGLVFQVYPEAIATLPGAQLWSVLFFTMLIMLGLDSAMGGMECVITGIMDEFRTQFNRWKFSRETFTFGATLFSFCIAITNITKGGMYVFHWFDQYAAGVSLLCSALFEAIAVSWFYGLERFCRDIKEMLRFKPHLFWRICWKIFSPCFILSIVIFGIVFAEPLTYNDYVYPAWANLLGWMFACSAIVMVPVMALVAIVHQPTGSFYQRLAIAISPHTEHGIIRDTGIVTRYDHRHWLQL